VVKVQRPLRGRQRDVHHGEIEDHHQLRQADHAEDEPRPPVPGGAGGSGIRHEIHHTLLWLLLPGGCGQISLARQFRSRPAGG
jgi:hypothetical protein